MFYQVIVSVILKKLSDESSDRRGHVAIFKLVKVAYMPYAREMAIKQIQALFGALGYMTPASRSGQTGEQGESWISLGEDGMEIFVQHKYWSDTTVTSFRQVVEAVAPIHQWQVVKEY